MTHANTELVRAGTPDPAQDASDHELGAFALAALALALLAVAGLASSVSPWHADRAAVSTPTTALHGLASVGGVVLVVALLLLWVETPTVRRWKRKKKPLSSDDLDELGTSLSTAAKTVAIVLLAVAIFCIAALPLLTRPSTPSQDVTRPRPHPSAPARTTDRQTGADPRDLAWLLLPIAVTFAILTPVAALMRRRRLRADEEGLDELHALGAVRASIAALESERDPRRAILLAYAQMEQAFRDVEVVRARDETASEFLGRTVRQLPVSAGDAAALTGRFEEARFSTHQLTEADRAQALAALRRVEWELGQRP